MTEQRWPESDDEVSRELRRGLDEAALRGPDDVTLRRGWSALSLELGADRMIGREGSEMDGSSAELAVAAALERSRARQGFWFAGGVATTAALALAAAFWFRPHVTGLSQANLRPKPAVRAELPLPRGARRLMLEGGVEAVLAQTSVMQVEDGAPRVEGGEVRFSVPHRRPGHPFVVRAEGYRVVVVGTRFGVAVDSAPDGKKAVGVDVDEGIVEVWEAATQQRVARLTPGERWQSPPQVPVAAARVITPTAAPTVATTPARSFRHQHQPTAHARRLALVSPGGGAASPAAAAALETPSAETLAARAALAAGDVPRALQLYRVMAQGTGPSAENASYEIGKVLNEKLGQPENAVEAWRRYRAAYPDGILRVEADVSIIETLARLGDSDEALGEANDFLRRHPDSERRAEIARLAGDLYRARGDCRHALVAYRITLGASRPRDAVEAAAFHRADCLVRLGDAGATDALRGYLRTYPSGKFRGDATALLGGAAATRQP